MPDVGLPIPTNPPPPEGVLRHLGIQGCARLPLPVVERPLLHGLESGSESAE